MENNKVEVTERTKKLALQCALWHLTNEQPFFGNLLQELTIKYRDDIPTAAITFSPISEQYEVHLGPQFFCNLTVPESVGVLHHEILHFTNNHLFRFPFLNASPNDRVLYNVAGDMAINQFINVLPKGGVDVKEWKLNDGKMFPLFQSMETYYDLIKNNKEANQDKFVDYQEFDQHSWEGISEGQKEKMLEEAKKALKRTIEKTSFSHSIVPDSIKSLLEEIEVLAASLNYKQILKRIIKRTVSSVDKENTWNKPNKRYGIYAPGSKLQNLPQLTFYNDSSGSISVTEQNEYLKIMEGFLTVGSRKCSLAFWHTSLYYKKGYRKGRDIRTEELESGGTDVTCVLQDIKKSNPDLSIILTDGYFDVSDVKINSEVVWIISKGGNKNHPMSHVGVTILLEQLAK